MKGELFKSIITLICLIRRVYYEKSATENVKSVTYTKYNPLRVRVLISRLDVC